MHVCSEVQRRPYDRDVDENVEVPSPSSIFAVPPSDDVQARKVPPKAKNAPTDKPSKGHKAEDAPADEFSKGQLEAAIKAVQYIMTQLALGCASKADINALSKMLRGQYVTQKGKEHGDRGRS